jgi:hydroxymethylbilane synthase
MSAGHSLSEVPRHGSALPLRVGTRGSPLALWQTRHFLAIISDLCPVLRAAQAFEEHVIATSGDRILDRRLADIGGKGLFAKEIHEALLDRRIDFAVHSLKDLETEMPPGIVLACTMKREDARDAIVLGEGCGAPDPADPYACLPAGALIGTASVRRQSQILFARPDLRCGVIRGNVQTRLGRVRSGEFTASLLALAGLKRLGMAEEAAIVLDPEAMVPAAGQGIVGITVRESNEELRELLSAIEDREAAAVSRAERAFLGALDGSCRTPIGGYAICEGDQIKFSGLIITPDGRHQHAISIDGNRRDAAALGTRAGQDVRARAGTTFFDDWS